MPGDSLSDMLSQFRQSLDDCRRLYRSSGEVAAREQPALLNQPRERFIELMDDLHRALLVKVFISVGQCDHSWSKPEQLLAQALVSHLWGRELEGSQLREAILEMSEKALALKWYALVRPFDQIPALRSRVGDLETLVVRIAHLVARADGAIKDGEAARIKSIQEELRVHLRPVPIDEPAEHAAAEITAPQAVEKVFKTADQLPSISKSSSKTPGKPPSRSENSATTLAEAMTELDALTGLAGVKHEVRTLANFLRVQTERTNAGLPAAALGLHMIFGGNPGTGKTSVARIVGKIFGAMGVLSRGHLVETDRSGLVAAYAGQTGPKTHKKIDEALDGVLFIDEAYTLIHAEGDDPYGHEAVQTLLKRMEDDRDRLVVILAGYPAEMKDLLQSNPGLSSRFSRHFEFADYTPLELSRIFSQMCAKNHYRLDAATRAKIMLGLDWLYRRRDQHFGNGRAVRNLFEHAIRRQANRIAEVSQLSVAELTALDADDVEFVDCPAEAFTMLADGDLRFHITCDHCQHGKDVPAEFLGQIVRCPKCKREFIADGGDVAGRPA
jgi:SpoVK/Ycf46/Vps4 family AAA+-type ATPase